MMRMVDLIHKKRRGEELTDEEIRFFVSGVTDGSLPDYQISAFCMAVSFVPFAAASASAFSSI